MAVDTVVLPPEDSPTHRLSVPGAYSLNQTRCVVEISVLLLGFSPLRVRMRATAGELAVDGAAAGCPLGVLRLELAGAPVRTNLPMTERLFRRAIPGAVRLAVELSGIDLSAVGVPIRVDGAVWVKRASPAEDGAADEADRPRWPLRMAVRLIPTENDVVVLAISGRARSPRKPPRGPLFLSVLRSLMRVEAAVEFTRCPL